jgi:transposase
VTIVAHTYAFVIGVDTHARTHTYVILAAATGEVLDTSQFPATAAGMSRAIAWVARRTGGDLAALWVIEGIGSYGAGLARAVGDAGYQVVEAARMEARSRQGTGKSDPIDAHRIAAAVLPLDTSRLRHPRADPGVDQGVRAALQVLVTARDQMSGERTAHINALTGLLRAVDLGVDARKPLTLTQTRTIARWRARHNEDLATATARAEAIRLALRITTLDADLAANQTQITAIIKASPAAALLDHHGIGPMTAAIILTAWSHPGRLRDEAAFAALAGVNPIPASSGNTTRHRLNSGGDRRLNRALHMIVITRTRRHPETLAYIEKRRAQGRTDKEIRRCLKRYLARQLYRTLNTLYAAPSAS